MLIKKIYNEETKTEKAWFDSSMFFHTVMIEDPAENKGDLYVTFKNGATYLYKDVAFEDYVLLIGGAAEMSQGKSLNKYINQNTNLKGLVISQYRHFKKNWICLVQRKMKNGLLILYQGTGISQKLNLNTITSQ